MTSSLYHFIIQWKGLGEVEPSDEGGLISSYESEISP